jgi:hypothetical protein
MTELEGQGVPCVFVASTEFVQAAAAQARALGFEPAAVFVAHPVQDRTDAEVRALAEAAEPEVWARITSGAPH